MPAGRSSMNKADWFASAFGSAVEDIRARMIDEAWFGRRAGASAQHHHTHEHHHSQDPNAAERDIHGNGRGNEHGIDR